MLQPFPSPIPPDPHSPTPAAAPSPLDGRDDAHSRRRGPAQASAHSVPTTQIRRPLRPRARRRGGGHPPRLGRSAARHRPGGHRHPALALPAPRRPDPATPTQHRRQDPKAARPPTGHHSRSRRRGSAQAPTRYPDPATPKGKATRRRPPARHLRLQLPVGDAPPPPHPSAFDLQRCHHLGRHLHSHRGASTSSSSSSYFLSSPILPRV